MARFIALYLPQYHPIPENDEWWGKGFTEWTNVAKAKKWFKGHHQPHIPADLGFYDLRLPIVREQQAELARGAGIEGFMYYHYWFGNGKRLLDTPFNEVVSSGKPDFPFCLCWANHSWYKKTWDPNSKSKNILLQGMAYSEQDFIDHFYALLPAFKDERYIRINGKLLFGIYTIKGFDDCPNFIKTWRKLAEQNGLGDFFFIGEDADSRQKEKKLSYGMDAIFNDDGINIHHKYPTWKKVLLYLGRKYLGRPTQIPYKKAIKYMINSDCENRETIPVVIPNWDHSPRSGKNAFILTKSKPEYFQELVEQAIDVVSKKPEEEQIVIIKSWNEWGEGNYLEPDLEFGHGYLDALKNAIQKKNAEYGHCLQP